MELPPIYYDTTERVLLIDFTGVTLTSELLEQILHRIIDITKNLPHKVYALTCWKDAILPPEVSEQYGLTTAELLKYVRGIVRYESNIMLTNVTIRANTVRLHLQGSRSNLFSSKEEALAAIRELEKNTHE